MDRYGEVLELRRQLGDRRGQALARTALGALARRLGEPRLALGHLGEALELWRAEGDRRRTAITLNDLGLTLLELGDREAAAERLAEAAEEHAAIGADHGEAVARNDLCLMHLSAGEPATARPCFEGAIELFAAAGERRGEALARNSLAGVYDQLGEPGSALEELERAHRLVTLLGDRRGQAHLLANRAALYRRLGEPRAALADYGRALPILRQLDDRRWLARTVNNLGFAYLELGEPERARGFFEEALELRLEVGDPLGEAVTRNNLGRVHRQLGEPAAAWRAHRKAEELLTRLDDRERLATTRSLIGEALLDLGKPGAALASFERALELEGTTGERRRRRGNVLVRTAWAHLALGDAGAALRRLDEALALFRTLDDRDGEAEARVVAAKAQLALGRLDDALATVDRALAHFESQRERIVNPRLQATFLDVHRRGGELKVEILMARHRGDPTAGFAERALAAAESSRARVLRDLLASSDASLGVPAEVSTRRRDLLRRLRAQGDRRRRLLDAGKRTEAEDAEREVAQLLAALDVLDAEIERRRPGFAELTAGRPFDLPRLRAALGDAVLLEYALGEERSYLWRVTASDLEVFELPPRSRLEAAARAAYLELRTVTAGEEEGGAVREAAELLLSPVWHRLSGRRLSIVPDGTLHHLPFGALPGAEGRPLAVDHEVVHLPVAPPLAAPRRPDGTAAGRSIAVFADPVFSRDDPRLRGDPGAAGQAAAAARSRARGAPRKTTPWAEATVDPRSPLRARAVAACYPPRHVFQDVARSPGATVSTTPRAPSRLPMAGVEPEPVAIEPREEAEVAAELVRRIRGGNAAAEGSMVERYSRGLLGLLRRRTGDPALAEDLHQEVFRIVLVRLRESGLEEPEKLAAFLHGTANHLVVAHFRKSTRRRTETDPGAGDSGVPPGQVDRLLRRERALLVRRLLSVLEPERDRQILFRFYVAEEEKATICADLGLSHDHFKRVLHRARGRFRQLLTGFEKRRKLEASAASLPPATAPEDGTSNPVAG